jgi:hypothetical protein
MLFEFKNLKELVLYFDSEDVCREYLEKKRWKDNIICVYCSCSKVYKHQDNRQLSCSCCKRRFTATTGTIFHNSKVPLSSWFMAIYLYTSHKSSVSAAQISRHIGISKKAAWLMHRKIMEAFRVDLDNLKADHGQYEVDEVYIGPSRSKITYKRKLKITNWFGGNHQTAILAFYKRNGGLFGLLIPNNATRQQIQPIVKKYIEPVSTLMTDGSGLYKDMDKYFLSHEVFNHSKFEYARGFHHTNTIEGSFRHFKDSIRGSYKRLTKKHMQKYWDEFCFRYNNRHLTDVERFNLVFDAIEHPITYKKVVYGKEDEDTSEKETSQGDLFKD